MPSPLPPDHHREVAAGRRLGRRERVIAAAMAVLVIAVAVVSIVSLASSSAPARRGCLNATVPGPIGATFFRQCGAEARQICATLSSHRGLGSFGAGIVARDCRRAGLPVG